MKKLFLYVFLGLLWCNASFSETSKAWKIDDKYLTPKCFIYEWLSSHNFSEFHDRYAGGLDWKEWLTNIGLYYGKEIPLEDSFEDSFGNTLSLTRYLKDCTSSKPIIEDEEKFLSYEVSGIKPKDSCKILAPNVSAKCLDIKIIKLRQKYLRMAPIMESHIYGIFELANKNKIILPLKMNYVVEKKTSEEKIEDTSSLDKVSYFGVPMAHDKFFYMGITPGGEPNKLLHIFEILIYGGNEETVYSEDGRYLTRTGCKLGDCGNKGLLWIDLKKKVAIGVISHSFWGLLSYKDGQIFIFSNYFENSKDFPDEFIKAYSNWIKNKAIKPSLYRFLNSKNEIKQLSQIK